MLPDSEFPQVELILGPHDAIDAPSTQIVVDIGQRVLQDNPRGQVLFFLEAVEIQQEYAEAFSNLVASGVYPGIAFIDAIIGKGKKQIANTIGQTNAPEQAQRVLERFRDAIPVYTYAMLGHLTNLYAMNPGRVQIAFEHTGDGKGLQFNQIYEQKTQKALDALVDGEPYTALPAFKTATESLAKSADQREANAVNQITEACRSSLFAGVLALYGDEHFQLGKKLQRVGFPVKPIQTYPNMTPLQRPIMSTLVDRIREGNAQNLTMVDWTRGLVATYLLAYMSTNASQDPHALGSLTERANQTAIQNIQSQQNAHLILEQILKKGMEAVAKEMLRSEK